MMVGEEQESEPSSTPSEWSRLGSMLENRIFTPIENPAYIFFCLISMLIGSIGIWVAIFQAFENGPSPNTAENFWANPSIFQSILTVFAAIGTVSCVQIVMTEDDEKHFRSLFVLLLLILLAVAIMAALVGVENPYLGYLLLLVGFCLATFSWWIANWDNLKFKQKDQNSPLGGKPDSDLAGSDSGYKT